MYQYQKFKSSAKASSVHKCYVSAYIMLSDHMSQKPVWTFLVTTLNFVYAKLKSPNKNYAMVQISPTEKFVY